MNPATSRIGSGLPGSILRCYATSSDTGSRAGSPADYFAAAAALIFASARRSIFLRRTARFLTLSLPLQCPIGLNKHALAMSAKLFYRFPVKNTSHGSKKRTFQRFRNIHIDSPFAPG